MLFDGMQQYAQGRDGKRAKSEQNSRKNVNCWALGAWVFSGAYFTACDAGRVRSVPFDQ